MARRLSGSQRRYKQGYLRAIRHRKRILGPKRIKLFQEILQSISYDDMEVIQEDWRSTGNVASSSGRGPLGEPQWL